MNPSRKNSAILLALLILIVSYCSFVLSEFPRSIAGVNHDFEDLDDEAVVERINLNNPSWTAGVNKDFEGKRVRDLKYLLGIELEDEDEEIFNNATSPESRRIQETCGGVNCGALSCCNGACYNSGQYTCTNGQLCPSGMKACGRACYNPTQYHCDNGVLKSGGESSAPSPSPAPAPTPAPSPAPAPTPSPAPSPPPVSGGIPSSFDARTKWPNCISAIKSQGSCGACWAFGAAGVLSDRICIASNGRTKVDLSPQYQVNCNSYNLGCRGGYMSKTWTFLGATGTTSETCTPYNSASNTSQKPCANTCTGSGSFVRYRANASTVKKYARTDLNAVMTDIMTYGPVHASYYVYSDFYYYKSGVYTHTYGSLQAGHAIRIVGWGTDSASRLPYWIVANSWGPNWGMNGYFWIRRGTNECSIEGSIYSARALL